MTYQLLNADTSEIIFQSEELYEVLVKIVEFFHEHQGCGDILQIQEAIS